MGKNPINMSKYSYKVSSDYLMFLSFMECQKSFKLPAIMRNCHCNVIIIQLFTYNFLKFFMTEKVDLKQGVRVLT
jgi:hypothetical protein